MAGDYPGSDTDTVTAQAADNEGNIAVASDQATITYRDVLPEISVSYHANLSVVPETGGNVTFTLTVVNHNREGVTLNKLSDSVFGDLNGQGACSVPQSLGTNGDAYTCTFTQWIGGDYPGNQEDIVLAQAGDDDGNVVTAKATASVAFSDVLPAISVVKTANVTSVPETGGHVLFSIVVTNQGNELVTLSALSDSSFGDLNKQGTCHLPQRLTGQGGHYACTFTKWIAGDYPGSDTDTVTATAFDDEKNFTTATANATVTFYDVLPEIGVSMHANPNQLPASGGVVLFTVVVSNTNTEATLLMTLSDSVVGDLNGQGTCHLPQTIPANGDTYSCTFTRFVAGTYPGSQTSEVTAEIADDEGNTALGTGDATVTFTDALQNIHVVKSAEPSTLPETGGTVTFAITVTNRGNESAILMALDDSRFGNLNGQGTCHLPQTLHPLSGSYRCTFTHFIAGDHGDHHNDVVTATFADNNGNSVQTKADATVTFTDVLPAIGVSINASPATVPETGGTVLFTIQVTNLSPEAVAIDSLNDSGFGNLAGQGSCTVGKTLAANDGVYSCSFAKRLIGEPAASHIDTITVGAVDDDGHTVQETATATVTFADVLPDVSLRKTVSPRSRLEPGGVFTYTLTIDNASTEPVTITLLSDANPLSPACTALVNTVLAGQDSATCAYNVSLTTPGSYPNSAAVTVRDSENNQASAAATATATVGDIPSSLAVRTRPNALTLVEPGGPMQFTVWVTNTSAVDTVTLTSLADDINHDGATDVSYDPATNCNQRVLAPGTSAQCSFTRTLTGNVGDLFRDKVTVTATDDDNDAVSAANEATVVIVHAALLLKVSERARPANVPEPGDVVTFTVQTFNLNPAELVVIDQLVDSVFQNITTTGHDGVSATTCTLPQTLAARGGSYTCHFVALVAGNFGDNQRNVTIVSGHDDVGAVIGVASAEVDISNTPSTLTLTETTNLTQVPESGGVVTSTVTVRNTSAVDSVTVDEIDDNLVGNVSTTCTPALPVTLAPDATTSCTFSSFLKGNPGVARANIVTAHGVDDDGLSVQDSATTVINFTDEPAVLDVLETANPSQVPETGADVEYRVVATNHSATDAITIYSLYDDPFGFVSSSCTPTLPVTVQPGQHITCIFTRFLKGNATQTQSDTVMVYGIDDDANLVAGSADTTVTFSNVLPSLWVSKNAGVESVPASGTGVTFTVRVQNTSTVDSLIINGLSDSIYGDVAATSNAALTDTNCLIPQSLPPEHFYTCQFTAPVTGRVGAKHINEVTATVVDDDGHAAVSLATATVTVTAPVMLATKRDRLLDDRNGDGVADPGDIIGYTVILHNVGDNDAFSTLFSDTLDAHVTLLNDSVTTSQGVIQQGNGNGDASVLVQTGDIAPAAAVFIRFNVKVNDPLPPGVTKISNQGLLYGDNFPTTPTDAPDTPSPGDPTVTPVVAAPDLLATKRDQLSVDADGDGTASPGDTVEYHIVVVNTGNRAATDVVAKDLPDPNTTLIAGSVTASQGAVVQGNGPNDKAVAVAIGALAGEGGALVITYQVRINDPLPSDVLTVANQAIITSNEQPIIPSDDPHTHTFDDPTVTHVRSSPRLFATLQALLSLDADGDQFPSPGDTLLYNIVIHNNGNTAATAIILTDELDANTALEIGSVRTTLGALVHGSATGDTGIEVDIGELAAGDTARVSFRALINDPLPANVKFVTSQALVRSHELPDLLSDDPTTANRTDPTTTLLDAAPSLVVSKVAVLFTDTDTIPGASAGDTLLYRVNIRNVGNEAAANVVLADTPDANTTLLAGTVQSSLGAVRTGNSPDDKRIRVEIGALAGGHSAVISFLATINPEISASQVSNQALVYLDAAGPSPTTIRSDDPDLDGAEDPTITFIQLKPTGLDPTEEPDLHATVFIFLPLVVNK